ncbi:MAG: hypothetical protein K2X03_22950 [Bryobacteraceae bacterium]|nr:hypothetical protein [Bryobacteraceae bacterium]
MTLALLRGPLCGLLFVFLCCTMLPYPGVQTDEALFAGIYFQPYESIDGFRAFHHQIPTMLMTYLGALKTWLYYPLFQLVAPTVWSLRLPMVLLGGASVWLFTLFLARLHGERAAWFGGLLLATDPMFIETTTFDWGPVALQHFLFIAAGVLLLRQTTRAWCFAFFLLGLALWNKALAAWTLVGLSLPLLILFPGLLRQHLTPRRLGLAIAFFAIGAFPFLRYNVRKPAATVQENVKLTTTEIQPKARLLYETLRGYAMMEYLTYEPKGPLRWTFIPHALLAAMILLLFWPSRLAWFPICAGAIIFLLMAMTRNAGGAVHHQILIWPLPYWAIAAAFTAPRIARPTLAWAVVALLAVDNARVVNVYRQALEETGSPGSWNNAIFRLVERIGARRPKTVRVYDWGMSDNLSLLTRGSVEIAWNDRPFAAENFARPADLWIGTLKPFEAFANVNQDLQEAVAKAGYERRVLEVIADRQGRPVYELFELVKR